MCVSEPQCDSPIQEIEGFVSSSDTDIDSDSISLNDSWIFQDIPLYTSISFD